MITGSAFDRAKWLAAACSAAALFLCGAAPPALAGKSASRTARSELTGTWKSYRPGGIKFNPRLTTPVSQGADPPLKPKYLAAWKARQKAAHEADLRGQPVFGGYEKCIPDGMPSMMMAMFPMDVLQTPGQITIIEEAYRQVRYIYLNQKQMPIEDAEPEFWGHSVGHWVGDTLVVNTVGIKPEVRFRDVPHSNLMQIDERIHLLSPNRFEDRVTITDPFYLVKPWTFTWEYQRLPGYKMLEYVCESRRVVDKNGAQHMLLFNSPSARQAPAKSQKAGTH
ncbi:MAG: hypothetical protein ACREU3_18380 [Steroidobacteraceae bacterium]